MGIDGAENAGGESISSRNFLPLTMTVSREITKWGGKIFFVHLSGIDLTRYEILNFEAYWKMWNDGQHFWTYLLQITK